LLRHSLMSSETQEAAELRAMLSGRRVAIVTTASADGALHSRPAVAVFDRPNGAIRLFLQPSAAQADDIRANGKVSLSYSALDGTHCASLSASATVVEEEGRVLAQVTVEKAEYWESPADEHARVVVFAPARDMRVVASA
jgi:general stress protein 26